MSCKQYGRDWKKDVSAQELLDELDARRKELKDEQATFFARAWPRREWCRWAPFVGTLICLGVQCFLLWIFLPSFVGFLNANPAAATYLIPLIIFGPAFLALFLYSMYFSKKEKRLRGEFEERYPDAKLLLPPGLGS